MKQYSQSRKGKLAWAFEELQIFHNTESDQPAEDFTAIYLESPDVVEVLNTQLEEFIVHAQHVLETQGFRFACNFMPKINREFGLTVRRSVTIGIENLKHLIEPGFYTPANSRLDITLSATGGLAHNHSSIHFPSTTNFDLITLIMKNTESLTPEMCFSKDTAGDEFICITFQSGYGVSSEPDQLNRSLLKLLYHHIHFLAVSSEAVSNPTGYPGVHGVIEAANLLATKPER